jgi:hypothetical protein
VVVHQVYDCSPVDDLLNELEESTARIDNLSRESEERAKSLASVFESKLRVKAASADKLNESTLKQLSLWLAREIECGQDPQKVKELLQRQLRLYV